MRKLILAASVLAIVLGSLWLIQGLGLVHVRPILCVADCDPVEGPSLGWALAGAILALLGLVGIYRWAKARL